MLPLSEAPFTSSNCKPGTKRLLRVGPNKGDVAPREVVDLIEVMPLVNPDDVNLFRVDF